MLQRTKLMTEFPAVPTAKWEEVITTDLKGADYDKKLVWKPIEGFAVRPYYRAEDLAGLKFLDSKPGEFPYVRSAKTKGAWLVRQTIAVDSPAQANATAQDVLTRGAQSIGFVVADKEFTAKQLDTLLENIDLKSVELAFSGCAAAHMAELFIDKVNKENMEVEDVKATFAIDPLKRASTKGSLCENGKCFAKIAELIKKTGKYKRIRIVSVGGVLFNSCGADAVQELAFALAMGHEYIVKGMENGLTIDQIAPSIKFNMAIGGNYFIEMAKFRAGRMLWANVTAPYKPERGCSSKMRVHATTSWWSQSIYDPYVNMLRGTTQAMSAALAGVDSIEVLPYDNAWAEPSEFSSRIARNTQLLLKEESHFDQVIDPAAGSYYIETLTDLVAQKSWELFKQVEEKGGYIAALKAGFIQEQIAATAAKRDKAIATRRQTLLGVNQYPNFTEVLSEDIPSRVVAPALCSCSCQNGQAKADFAVLTPYRGAMALEAMRMATDRSGKEVHAFMLTCGTLSMARARAQFAANFFGCAGIKPIDNTYFNSVSEGVEAALKDKAAIVVVCSADEDYATLAIEAYKALKGKAIVVVAGDPACRAELEAAGLTHFISVKSNLLETLKSYQKELGI
ncbi:MAG: methylmalonyl-CoA mutase family protein [Mucinivorans sp.]